MEQAHLSYKLSEINDENIKSCDKAYFAFCSVMFQISVLKLPKVVGHVVGSFLYLKYRFFKNRKIDYENLKITYYL